ncbi:MAG: DUF4340 domain-containing protein, partial [Ignavibacteriales bacterium]|nr:DUF4340 domain-containing protein [Ignavibacteriales bacterium]
MNKSTTLLIALLIVLGIVVYFLLPSSSEREASYKPALASIKIDSAAVVKIEIKQPSAVVVLENIGGNWEVTSPLHASADPIAIAQLLNGFSKFTVGSLISSNPEKQHLFHVDTSGTRITIADRTGKTTSMIIGKMGPSFSEVYFRLPDSKDVYLGEGIDTWSVNKNVKDWRDRSIVRTTSESIKELNITVGSKVYSFNHEGSIWKAGDKTLETSEMNPILNTLSNLRADDFVDTVTEIKSKPIYIAIKGFENVSLSLYPILPDTAKYFVRASKSSQLYVISKWTAQQLFKPIEKSPTAPRTVQPVVETPVTEITPEPREEKPTKEALAPIMKEEMPPPPPDTKPEKEIIKPKPEVGKKQPTKTD